MTEEQRGNLEILFVDDGSERDIYYCAIAGGEYWDEITNTKLGKRMVEKASSDEIK